MPGRDEIQGCYDLLHRLDVAQSSETGQTGTGKTVASWLQSSPTLLDNDEPLALLHSKFWERSLTNEEPPQGSHAVPQLWEEGGR